MAPLAALLLGDERGLVLGLASRSLRASISLERKSSTVSRSIASLRPATQKTGSVSFWLAPASFFDGSLELAGVGEREVDVDVAVTDLAAVEGEAGLERLDVEERVRGLRLPEAGDNLGVDARAHRRASG